MLVLEGVEEGGYGCRDVGGCGGEAFDEFGTYDGAGGVGLGGGEGGGVGDAEAYEAFVVEVHGVDAAEVVELRVAEAVAGACSRG